MINTVDAEGDSRAQLSRIGYLIPTRTIIPRRQKESKASIAK